MNMAAGFIGTDSDIDSVLVSNAHLMNGVTGTVTNSSSASTLGWVDIRDTVNRMDDWASSVMDNPVVERVPMKSEHDILSFAVLKRPLMSLDLGMDSIEHTTPVDIGKLDVKCRRMGRVISHDPPEYER